MLSNEINDYHIVAQGKTTIPGVDDHEECTLTDVSSALEDKRLGEIPIVFVHCRRNQPAGSRRISSYTDRDCVHSIEILKLLDYGVCMFLVHSC